MELTARTPVRTTSPPPCDPALSTVDNQPVCVHGAWWCLGTAVWIPWSATYLSQVCLVFCVCVSKHTVYGRVVVGIHACVWGFCVCVCVCVWALMHVWCLCVCVCVCMQRLPTCACMCACLCVYCSHLTYGVVLWSRFEWNFTFPSNFGTKLISPSNARNLILSIGIWQGTASIAEVEDRAMQNTVFRLALYL